MEKVAETDLITPQKKGILTPPKGVDPERFFQASQAKALMRAEVTPGGSVTVNCPYCLLFWRTKNPVDVTKFMDSDGQRECKTSCNKGHTLKFRPIPQWREERQKMGLQVKG